MDLLLNLLLSLILTVIAYLAFPIIRLVINHGKFTKKQAKKIALWNSIIVGAFFCIVTIATSDSGTTWNAAPAVLYYFINCAILTDKNAEKEENHTFKTEGDTSQEHTYSVSNSYNGLFSDTGVRVEQNTDTKGISKKRAEELLRSLMDDSTTGHNQNASESNDTTNMEIRFCRKCGNKLSEDSLFCNKCGTKIN